MIHFCLLLGGRISAGFVVSLLKLSSYLDREKIPSRVFDSQGADIYLGRNLCVAPMLQGNYPPAFEDRKPYNGELDYEFIFWIDSDVVFEPEQVMMLTEHKVDMVTGMVMKDPKTLTMGYLGKTQDGDYYHSDLPVMKIDSENRAIDTLGMWVKEKQEESGLCPIDLCGSAFLCIRKGVYEAMPYPWYRTTIIEHGPNPILASEDTGFIWRATQTGFKAWADPLCIVGHEKVTELRG